MVSTIENIVSTHIHMHKIAWKGKKTWLNFAEIMFVLTYHATSF